ncbi:protein Niban 1 [Suncus etruscus]|uniref:protein Niban 1 n=1 Tax=Suncus etruscus TaxID=109475 RepID=UPI00211085D9|nr:protein Niban 1 [Suncus etruscus]
MLTNEQLISFVKRLDKSDDPHQGKTEAAIRNFGPFYRRQYSVAFCGHVCHQLEPHRDPPSQLLKTKPPLEPGTVLYEAALSQFADDIKKWKERYVVVKNDFVVETYENKEAFQKGSTPRCRLLPAGGQVLMSEAEYNALSDRHFPDPSASNEKEAVPLPSAFPVFLWQPFVRPGSFCCQDAAEQRNFSGLLEDCIRHLNQDYVKQRTFEARAFLEAVQFFQQEKGHYDSWEMNMGDEIQILSGLVMDELLPTLQADLLPRMKGKRQDWKRAWLGLLEEAYGKVKRQVSEGLEALKEECRAQARDLEGSVRADADQIATSKNFLSAKIKEMVVQPAEKSLMESVQPFLASLLEELMGPISSGFGQVRDLFEREVDELSRSFQSSSDGAQLQEHLQQLGRLPLDSTKMEPCYTCANLLLQRSDHLQSRFRFPHTRLVVQRAQSNMQELMGNAVFTFEQLLAPHLQAEAPKTAAAIEKVKLRVLKQYDYDSSSVRKRLCQDALVQVTLPVLRRSLATTCKPELQKYEQFIFADHTSMIHVENVYEEILQEMLVDEALRVIKEATSLKKHNLLDDSMTLPSESMSSLSDLKILGASAQASSARSLSVSLPGGAESEALNNEVFQEPGDETQLGGPSAVARTIRPSSPEPSVPQGQDGPGLVSSPGDPRMSSGTFESAAGDPDMCSAELEFGRSPEPQEPQHQMLEAVSTTGSLDELRALLTVTIEVPAGSSPLETCEGDLEPEEKVADQGETCASRSKAGTPPCRQPPNNTHSPEAASEPQTQEGIREDPHDFGEPGEVQGGMREVEDSPSMEAEETKVGIPHVYECQWVVEGALDLEFQGPVDEGPCPDQALE